MAGAAAPQQQSKAQTALARRQEQVGTVRTLLEKSKDQIAMALPKHLTPERLMRVAMTTIQKNPKLLEADPRTLIGAIIQCAQLGLEPDSVLGHAYLVPFWNNTLGRYDVTFIPGYKGLIGLAKRGGEVEHIHAVNVYEGDHFKYVEGLNPVLEHTPVSPSKRTGPKIGTYAVVKYRDGGREAIWMWAEEIEIIRDRVLATRRIDTKKQLRDQWGPWGTDEDEMFKKTAIRRISKVLSLSPEFQKAAALDEMAEAGIPQNLDQEVFLGPEGIVSAEMQEIAGRTAEKAGELRNKLAERKAEADKSGLNAAPPPEEKAPSDAEPSKQDAAPDKTPAGDAQPGAGAAKQGGGATGGRRKGRSSPQEAPAGSAPPADSRPVVAPLIASAPPAASGAGLSDQNRHRLSPDPVVGCAPPAMRGLFDLLPILPLGLKVENTDTPPGPGAGEPFPAPEKETPPPENVGPSFDQLRTEIRQMVQAIAAKTGWKEEGAFNKVTVDADMAFKYRYDQLPTITNRKDLEALHGAGKALTTTGGPG